MKCVIVDDEYPSREELKFIIEKNSGFELIGNFDDPIEALQFIQKENVDVVFLDINMPKLDGMNMAKLISKVEEKPYIIFVTAYRDYAVEAYEIKAFDYILKPYEEARVIELLKQLELEILKGAGKNKESVSKKIDKITIWKDDKMHVVQVDEIYYCEVFGRDTKIFTDTDVFMAKQKISELEKILPEQDFFRTHRSYIVNINKIKEIIPWFNNSYDLKLKDMDVNIPVSRNRVKEFREMINVV